MDQKLLFLINRECIHPVLDRVMVLLSAFDVWLGPLLLLPALLVWRGGFNGRAFLLVASCVVAINDGLVSNPLKHLVDRPRPFQSYNDVRQVELARAKPQVRAAF